MFDCPDPGACAPGFMLPSASRTRTSRHSGLPVQMSCRGSQVLVEEFGAGFEEVVGGDDAY